MDIVQHTPRARLAWPYSAMMLGLTLSVAGCLASSPAPVTLIEQPSTSNAGQRASSAVGFPEFPSLSSDGESIVFSWAGDLWITSRAGGPCARLTASPATERRSAFSPDGSQLAFESDRDGARNLYVMTLQRTPAGVVGSGVRRVTVSDRPQNLSGWTSDGKGLLFTAVLEPAIYRSPRMYRVDLRAAGPDTSGDGLAGGPVMPISPAYGFWPRMTGDGLAIVFQRNNAEFERPHYRGSGTSDLWRLSLSDGAMTRLTDDPANDYDPWPTTEKGVVFVSSRDGENNLWRLSANAGDPAQQLTRFQVAPGQPTIAHGVRDLCVARDGSAAVFCVWDRLYRLDLTRADAKPEAIDLAMLGDFSALDTQRVNVEKDASEGVLSPDGKTLAVVARGEVFVRNVGEGYPTRRVTSTSGRERDLAWSPDGRVLYFASDDPIEVGSSPAVPAGSSPGQVRYHLYQASVALSKEDLVPEKDKEKDKDADDAKKDEKKDDASEASAEPKAEAKDEPKSDAKPDPAKPEAEKPDAAKPEGDAAKDAKGKKKKDKQPDFGKRWSEALRFKIEPVTSGPHEARQPVPSPDGRLLVYSRDLGDVVMLNLETREERVLQASWNEADVLWMPDSRHVIYAVSDLDYNSDIWLLDTGGAEPPSDFKMGQPVNLTRHPDLDTSPRLSADGKVLTFLSERGTQSDQTDIYQVYLDKSLEGMTAYERDEYFKKAGEAAGKRKPASTPAFALKKDETKKDDATKDEPKKDEAKKDTKPKGKKVEPLKIDADDAYLRIRRITSNPGDKSSLSVTPGADRIIFSTTLETEPGLVSIDFKGQDRKTLQAGAVSNVEVSLTGDKVSYIRSGVVSTISPKAGSSGGGGAAKADALAIDSPMVIDVGAQQRQKFLEAARTFGDRWYHPTMKGLDWPALTRSYLTLAERTRSVESFNRVVQMLFGETDGSHTGITGGGAFSAPSVATGYLGTRVEPVNGGYRVVRVTAESPAAQTASKLEVGDVILSVEGRRFASDDARLPTLDFDAAFAGRAGRETLLEVRRVGPESHVDVHATEATGDAKPAEKAIEKPAGTSAVRTIVIVPAAYATLDPLRYGEEVRDRRALVEKLSGGRLGYLHIRAMGEASVREFERDLYAAAHGKDGLVIDVRDNGGGSTADILLSSLTAPRHAWTAPRGVDLKNVPSDSYPRDRRLIYGYVRPIAVVINQNSFSNAEIFAHAIKTTGRGRLIGTATFGGVISTGAFTLIDGTNVRMPGRGWYLPDGKDLENNGAKPDVDVPMTPADEGAGRDPQLEAAVRDLLKSVDAKK